MKDNNNTTHLLKNKKLHGMSLCHAFRMWLHCQSRPRYDVPTKRSDSSSFLSGIPKPSRISVNEYITDVVSKISLLIRLPTNLEVLENYAYPLLQLSPVTSACTRVAGAQHMGLGERKMEGKLPADM